MNKRRRLFLKHAAGLGALTVGSPLLRTAWARAQGNAPKNLLVFFTPHGFHMPDTISGGENDFTLGAAWSPLQQKRDQYLFLRNIGHSRSGEPETNDHRMGALKCLTGRAGTAGNGGRATGPSIDHFIGSKINKDPWVHHAYTDSRVDVYSRISFKQLGNNIVPDEPQFEPFARLGGNSSPFTVMTEDEASVTLRRNRDRIARSVSYAKSQSQLIYEAQPQHVRERLEVMQDTYADLEASHRNNMPPSGSGGCTEPQLGQRVNNHHDTDTLPTVVQQHASVIIGGMACGATRLGTLVFTRTSSHTSHTWLRMDGRELTRDIHLGIAHETYNSDFKRREWNTITRWYSEQMNALVDKLSAAGILDSTMVMWVSELGDCAQHQRQDMGIVLAGGGDAFRKGRFLRLRAGTPHNRLLQFVAEKMGVSSDGFGDPRFSTGALTEL